ncbi:hypothetical protein ACP70R_004319 [Stipagrostis hirtigluma subsp. patula]
MADLTAIVVHPAAPRKMVVYACDRPTTLERLKSFWLPELWQLQLKAPVIVLGRKLDLRDEQQGCLESLMNAGCRCLRSSTMLGCAGRMLEAEESNGSRESGSLARMTMNIHHDTALQDVKAAYRTLARKRDMQPPSHALFPLLTLQENIAKQFEVSYFGCFVTLFAIVCREGGRIDCHANPAP